MLEWRHRIGPGFLVLISLGCFFSAFLLQLLVSIGLPSIKSIYFLVFTLPDLAQEVKFGIWTICTDIDYTNNFSSFFNSHTKGDDSETCQPSTLGYNDSQYGPIAHYLLVHSLSRALVVQPVSCGLAAVATLSALLHLCTNVLLWPLLGLLSAAAATLTFVFEIILFSVARVRLHQSGVKAYFGYTPAESSFGPGIWIQLAAMVVAAFAMLMQWTAYVRRRLRASHTDKLGRKTSTSTRAASSYAGSVRNVPSRSSASTAKTKRAVVPANAKRGKSGDADSLATANTDDGSQIPLRDMAAPMAKGSDRGGPAAATSAAAATASAASTLAARPRQRAARRKEAPSYDAAVEQERARQSQRERERQRERNRDRRDPFADNRDNDGDGDDYDDAASDFDPLDLRHPRQKRGSRARRAQDDDEDDLPYILGARPASSSQRSPRSPRDSGRRPPVAVAASDVGGYGRERGARRGYDYEYDARDRRSGGGGGGGAESDVVVSTRKGRRAARYSARMAEEGLE